jgi:hypothetical protein
MADFQAISTFGPGGLVNALVEAPQGAKNKCKYDHQPELDQFFRSVVLGSGKKLTFQGWNGPGQVLAAIRKGACAVKGP